MSSSARWRRARGPVLEIGEQLLDDGLRVGSYRLIERLGVGRDGRGLAGPPSAAGPSGGRQARPADSERRRRGRSRAAPALRARSARHRRAAVAAHRAAVRLRHDRNGKLLLRDGTAARHGSAAHGRASRSAAAGTGDLPAQAGVPLAVRGARAWARASRHQAREPLCVPAGVRVRLPEGARLRRGVRRTRASRWRRSPWPGSVLGTPAFLAPEFVSARTRSTDEPTSMRSAASASGCSPADRRSKRKDVVSLLMHHSRTMPSPPSMFSEERHFPRRRCGHPRVSVERSGRPSATADHLWELLDATTVAGRWDQRRARAWWELHEPEIIAQV